MVRRVLGVGCATESERRLRNPKSKARNPKQIQNSKGPKPCKRKTLTRKSYEWILWSLTQYTRHLNVSSNK